MRQRAEVKEVTFTMAFVRAQAARAKDDGSMQTTLQCEHRTRAHADLKQWLHIPQPTTRTR